MRDYIKQEQKRKLKRYLLTSIFIFLVFIICLLSYYIYTKVEVDLPSKTSKKETTVERTVQTIEEVKKQNKTISEVLEGVNECIVGISKVKNTGTTAFSQNSASELGLGTGVIVAPNGYVLTNEHVSGKKYSTSYITLSTGKTTKGNVVWSNSDIDMAIIKINEKNLPYVSLGDSDDIKVGEKVYAIGNPIGYEFQRTVTSGIISALNRTIKFEENEEELYMEDLIQTDATINPGNSGGPLINIDGQVIGINSVKITSAEGIGFAVPINSVKSVINSFAQTGKFEEASLGIFAYDKSVIPYMNQNNEIEKGIYVASVTKMSAAEKANLRQGDIILSIDNQELNRMCELRCYIYTKKPKDEVTLNILRNKKIIQIKVLLDKK